MIYIPFASATYMKSSLVLGYISLFSFLCGEFSSLREDSSDEVQSRWKRTTYTYVSICWQRSKSPVVKTNTFQTFMSQHDSGVAIRHILKYIFIHSHANNLRQQMEQFKVRSLSQTQLFHANVTLDMVPRYENTEAKTTRISITTHTKMWSKANFWRRH